MDLHNLYASLFVRQRQLNLAVKTTRSEKSWIQNVRPISCRNNLDVIILSESVKLIKQFEHRPMYFTGLSLTTASFFSNSVKLIDKNYRRLFFFSKRKCVCNHLSTITNIHLHQLWSRKLHKSRIRLSSTSPSHQSLSSARRTMHQYTFGWSYSKLLEFLLVCHRKYYSFL